jgi:hypothetical protein
METRSIALGLIAVVAAFAVAFGAGKAAGGKTATTGVRAAAIKVAAPPAVSSVEVGGTIPALKADATKKSPAKKKKASSKTNNTTSTATAPSTNNTTPAPSKQVTPAQPKSNPAPKKKATGVGGGGTDGGAVTGGGSDG